MSEPHERLNKAMTARRLDLGVTWKDIAAAAQMSDVAVRSIRRGDYRPKDITARRLDEALKWPHGTVEAILDGTLAGDEPQLRVDTARTTRRLLDELQAEADSLMAELPPAMASRVERLIRHEEAVLRTLAAQSRAEVDELQGEIGRLMAQLPARRREQMERLIAEEEAHLEELRVRQLRRWKELIESD